MTPRQVQQRHWRSYGDDPLPLPHEAMDEPLRAFPSWFLRVECDRCGKVRMVNEAHAPGARGRCGRSSTAWYTTAAVGARRRLSC
jgi:hypothetical protein